MLNCHDTTFLLSQARERRLSFSERMKLKLHTSMCRNCAEFGRQLPLVGLAARNLAGASEREDP
jgi:hypothetical protein